MGQKSGSQLPMNSDAQRSKPGFGTVVRFGRVVIAHDIVRIRRRLARDTRAAPIAGGSAKRLKRHAKNWLRGGCRLCRDLPESAEISC